MNPATRRLTVVLALAATVVLGLLSRRLHLGWPLWDKSLGDALYPVAVYLVLSLVFPRWSVRRTAAIALLFSATIELFQLTGIPAAHSHLAVVRWLVGTEFSVHDLCCYLVGGLAIALLDGLWRRSGNAYT